jgi:tetratricopeptide (TPR) repeat protein
MAGVAAPYGPIFESELEALRGVPSTELTLADCTLKYYEFRRVLDRARHADALECYEVATEQQPDSPDAWAMLALLAAEQYAHGYGGRAASPLDEAREAARRAMDIDGNSLHANLALAATRFFGGEDFRPVAERILGTWPDNAEARAFVGAILILTGDTDRGRELVQGALATTERAPSGYYASNALAELRAGDIDAALASALRIDSPDWPLGHVLVAALATLAGRADLAARAKARALELEPTMATLLPELLRRWRAEAALAAEVERGFVEAGGP